MYTYFINFPLFFNFTAKMTNRKIVILFKMKKDTVSLDIVHAHVTFFLSGLTYKTEISVQQSEKIK